MLKENETQSIYDYLEIAWRRRWFIIIPFLVVIPIGISLGSLLPKTYRASTTILVIPQNVPDEFVKSTVTMNPSEYLKVLSQQIMSRTRLGKIINELSLFPELVDDTSLDHLVAIMRKNIEIDIQFNRDKGVSSFTLAYLGENPHNVMLTTTRLATLFIEENLSSREQQAKSTTSFLSNELGKLKETLNTQEAIISEFKKINLGSLPEQHESNLRMLDNLILQRQRISDELNDAKTRKILLQQQLLKPDNLVLPENGIQENNTFTTVHARIKATESKIAILKNKYTDEHPDVISTKAELKKLIALADTTSTDSQVEGMFPFESEIDTQLLSLTLEITSLKKEATSLEDKIFEYQSRIENSPGVEQEFNSLLRDYTNQKASYDSLMHKSMDAKQAERLEINQQGEQFKILDPATVPSKPYKPDPFQIIIYSFFISCGLAFGLVFLVEYLDHSFHNVKDLEDYIELPVLSSIPLFSSKEQ